MSTVVDFSAFSDEEVLQLRNEVLVEAERRLQNLTLLEDTKQLAEKARAMGRTKEQSKSIVENVLDQVYLEAPPEEEEPTFDPPPSSEEPVATEEVTP